MLYANLTALTFRSGVMADQSFILREYEFSTFFAPVTSTLTFIYELNPYSLDIYGMCENELPTSNLSKVIVFQPANACM